MYYIIFEDNTSCMDLTIQLLRTQVPNFDQICEYFSVCGAPQASDVFSSLVTYGRAIVHYDRHRRPQDVKCLYILPGDTTIFIVDATARIAKQFIPISDHIRGIRLFRTVYYCFESCLFSYTRFCQYLQELWICNSPRASFALYGT